MSFFDKGWRLLLASVSASTQVKPAVLLTLLCNVSTASASRSFVAALRVAAGFSVTKQVPVNPHSLAQGLCSHA